MSVNPDRGEVTLELEEVSYGLRPTFEAIKDIETKTGRSLRSLASAMNAIELPLVEMGIVAGVLMRAWGRAAPDAPNARVAMQVNDARVAELVFEAGVVAVAQRLTVLLVAAITGGVTASGELKASGTRGTITDA